jgi:hypothetical protein
MKRETYNLDGSVTVEEVYVPPPASVTPLQIRKALRLSGLKEQVDAFLAAQGEEVVEAWEYATQIEYDHPMINAAVAALGFTEEEKANLFALAANQ